MAASALALNVTTNGTAPLTYNWSNGATSGDLLDIPAGTYTVTVTDATGCTREKVFNVGQPAALGLTFSKSDVSCNGAENGLITATATGGVKFPTSDLCNGERYCFLWSNGATGCEKATWATQPWPKKLDARR